MPSSYIFCIILLLLCFLSFVQSVPPNAPNTVTIDDTIVTQQLTLRWVADTSGGSIDSFNINCQGSSDCPAQVTNVAPSETSYVYTGLTNGYLYSFSVTAVNSGGSATSAFSDESTPSCGSGVLEFSTSSVNVIESNLVTLTITRTGGSGGFVQVRLDTLTPGEQYGVGIVKTSKTTGTANYDFSPLINNQLIFPSGVTEQTLQFATLEDSLYEVNELVEIHLSQPSGGLGACRPVVGPRSPIRVTIIDNGDASISFNKSSFSGLEGSIIDVSMHSITHCCCYCYYYYC